MPTNLRSNITEITRELRLHLNQATKESAEAVRDRAKANVPVDEGDLMRAIHVERREMAEYAVVAGNQDVFYGHIVEGGAVGAGRGHSFSLPPRPFLVPALEVERLRIEQRVEEALRDIKGIER